MDTMKRNPSKKDRLPTSDDLDDKLARSRDDSESSYSQNSSTLQLKKGRKNGNKAGKISKQELKRVRNREAAKKSRKLKKDHILNLEVQNLTLRKQNERLLEEIKRLKEAKLCRVCSTMIPEEHFEPHYQQNADSQEVSSQIDEEQPAQEAGRRQDDDLRFERIIEEEDKHHTGLQKFFLGLILVLLILWLKAPDLKPSIAPLLLVADESISQNRNAFVQSDEFQDKEGEQEQSTQ